MLVEQATATTEHWEQNEAATLSCRKRWVMTLVMAHILQLHSVSFVKKTSNKREIYQQFLSRSVSISMDKMVGLLLAGVIVSMHIRTNPCKSEMCKNLLTDITLLIPFGHSTREIDTTMLLFSFLRKQRRQMNTCNGSWQHSRCEISFLNAAALLTSLSSYQLNKM